MKYTICILLYCTLFLVNSVYSLAGGTAVVVGQHPSHALVLVDGSPRGGTIVNANHVVTACSVVLDDANSLRPLAHFTVRAGAIAFAEGFSTPVIAVFPHPECNPSTLLNDVAVIRTTNSFTFNVNVPNHNMAPAVFNQRTISDAASCIVVGFPPPNAGVAPLQELVQPILNRDTVCNSAHNGRVLESMFCAGTVAATSGICESTIGGGIYCSGNFTGIASDGATCGTVNSPSVYTQVRHHIQWINAQFNRAPIQPGPTPPPGVSAGVIPMVTSTLLLCLAFVFTRL